MTIRRTRATAIATTIVCAIDVTRMIARIAEIACMYVEISFPDFLTQLFLQVVDWDAPPASSECVRSSSANTTPTHSRNSVAKDWGAMVSMDTPLLSSNAGTPHSHRTTEDLPLERRRESVSMQKHRVAPAVDESLKSSDFYVQEARRLKHLADASMVGRLEQRRSEVIFLP